MSGSGTGRHLSEQSKYQLTGKIGYSASNILILRAKKQIDFPIKFCICNKIEHESKYVI